MSATNNREKVDQILSVLEDAKSRDNTDSPSDNLVELVIFTLSGDLSHKSSENGKLYFAFSGDDVKEILPYEKIAFVPGCPKYIKGIINLRGEIESVIDLKSLFSVGDFIPTSKSRIIIAEKNQIRSGILVDFVLDVVYIPGRNITAPVVTLEPPIGEFTVGGETMYHDHYVTLLDVGKIFDQIVK